MTDADGALEAYRATCRQWLATRLKPRPVESAEQLPWGVGSDDVSVFHDLSFDEERELLATVMAWQQERFDGGYGAITWPAEYGGAELPAQYKVAFHEEEAAFDAPPMHETFGVTVDLVAPTVERFGTPGQRQRFVRRFLRAEELCCQLFSEPGAGSDLAGLARVPSATVTSGWSTARRCGARALGSRRGAS